MRLPATLACALLGLLPAAVPAASPEASPAPRHFLWEVSSLTNKVYLFGTVHAGKASFYPLPPPVERAFADSRILHGIRIVSSRPRSGKRVSVGSTARRVEYIQSAGEREAVYASRSILAP